MSVHETATVEKGAKIGEGTRIWHYAHVREGAVLGRDCVVGHCAYIGKDVKVGDNVKVENKSSVFIGVTIEDDVFIGPHVAFTNDTRPRSFNKEWKVVKTLVKKGASIGVNTTIMCGVTIGRYAMVGGGSVVTRDVPDHALVYGSPAKIKGFVCECGEPLEKKDVCGDGMEMRCGTCGKEARVNLDIYRQMESCE